MISPYLFCVCWHAYHCCHISQCHIGKSVGQPPSTPRVSRRQWQEGTGHAWQPTLKQFFLQPAESALASMGAQHVSPATFSTLPARCCNTSHAWTSPSFFGTNWRPVQSVPTTNRPQCQSMPNGLDAIWHLHQSCCQKALAPVGADLVPPLLASPGYPTSFTSPEAERPTGSGQGPKEKRWDKGERVCHMLRRSRDACFEC